MNPQRALVALILTLGLFCTVARADEITLKNGDHVNGKSLQFDGSKVTMDAGPLGKVSIDVKDISTVSSAEPIDVVLTDGSTVHGRVSSGPLGQITVTPGAGPVEVVPLSQVKKLNPPPVRWTGNFVLGGLLARGNTDSDSFNASIDLTRKTDKDQITLDGSYIFGRTRAPGQASSSETADDLLGKAKYDYLFTPKFYGYATIEAEHDVIAGVSIRLAPGVGVGYHWIDTPDLSFSTEGGAGYLYRKYSKDGEDGAPAARLAYHLKGKFNDKVSAFHDFEYLPGLDRIGNYYFDTDAGIQANLTEKMFTQFKVDYRYDSRPAPGRGASDLRFIVGVGWAF